MAIYLNFNGLLRFIFGNCVGYLIIANLEMEF